MNKIDILADYAIVYVTYKNKLLECLVDLEDLERVKKFTWYGRYSESADTYYVYTYIYYPKRRYLHLHRYLLRVSKENFLKVCVDHIDHNGLNNRRYNLVKKTKQENHYNLRRLNPRNTSGYRGVSFDKSKNRWIAQIQINRICHARSFSTKDEAIQEAKRMRTALNVEMGAE